jgi:hypothetical protein
LDDKKMKDLSYRSPKTEVRESPIHGRGLFAKQTIAAGEIVAVKGGYIFTRKEWTTLERQLGSSEVQISEELFIAPAGEEQISLHLPGKNKEKAACFTPTIPVTQISLFKDRSFSLQ